MEWLRRTIQHGLRGVDARYYRTHRLQPAGPVLYVGRAPYRGPAMQFTDDTLLETDDEVGALHFNNARFIEIDAASASGAALRFTRLMLQSMQDLAQLARTDPKFSDLAVFHAVSWLPPHGQRVGFITAPFRSGIRRAWMAAYFKLLIWAFAPVAQSRSAARPDPHHYWLTRKELLRRFPASAKDAKEFRGRSPVHVGARAG
jgi:hypothetical protein